MQEFNPQEPTPLPKDKVMKIYTRQMLSEKLGISQKQLEGSTNDILKTLYMSRFGSYLHIGEICPIKKDIEQYKEMLEYIGLEKELIKHITSLDTDILPSFVNMTNVPNNAFITNNIVYVFIKKRASGLYNDKQNSKLNKLYNSSMFISPQHVDAKTATVYLVLPKGYKSINEKTIEYFVSYYNKDVTLKAINARTPEITQWIEKHLGANYVEEDQLTGGQYNVSQ